jgi:BphX-like
MNILKWWLRIIGLFYILQFVMVAIVKAPIRVQGPEGALAEAAAGNPMAMFLVDTWVTFGLEVGAIGVVLLLASQVPDRARILVWLIIGIEISRGLIADTYMISRGHPLPALLIWLALHSIVILTGWYALQKSKT